MRTRNGPILTISQALAMSGIAGVVLLGGLIGVQLAPSPALATLPVSLMIVGTALFTIPAAMLMKRIGRRKGFMAGSGFAALAALLAAYAISQQDYFLFCFATLLIGTNGAFVQQYRFAASESVPPQFAARAVSFVLLGGIAAGFLGPEIAKRTAEALPAGLYTGSFVSIAVLLVLVVVLMFFLKDIVVQETDVSGQERPIMEIMIQPSYMVAVLAGAVAYGSMSLIMTATPLHLLMGNGFSMGQTTIVIQSHIIAMYLPSLFTGFLIERLGILRLMLLGVLGLAGSVFAAIVAQELSLFWISLVLLGVGWNFLFVGGTVLLTQSYFPAERFKAQAANDFTIFSVQAITSLSAGALLYFAGWDVIAILTVPFLLLTFVAVLLLRNGRAAVPSEA